MRGCAGCLRRHVDKKHMYDPLTAAHPRFLLNCPIRSHAAHLTPNAPPETRVLFTNVESEFPHARNDKPKATFPRPDFHLDSFGCPTTKHPSHMPSKYQLKYDWQLEAYADYRNGKRKVALGGVELMA